MKIFRSISGIASVVLLCTLLCSIEIEADRVQDEGQLPDLTPFHNDMKKSTHGHDLGVETMMLTDEQDKDVPSPKMTSAKAKTTMGKTTKAAAKKTNAIDAKVTSSVYKVEPETALVTSEHGRRLLNTQGGAMLDKCDICYEDPDPAKYVTDTVARGRIDADHHTDKSWKPDSSQQNRQACEIADLGYEGKQLAWTKVPESTTLSVQPCATYTFSNAPGNKKGNLEYGAATSVGGVSTRRGQCYEDDSTGSTVDVQGKFYTKEWAYTQGIDGTRSNADQSSVVITHARDAFPGSTSFNTTIAADNSCRNGATDANNPNGGGYIMANSLNRRASTPGSICFKDPDMLTRPTISHYDAAGLSGTTHSAKQGATQAATVQFAITDQNNYFDEDAGAHKDVLNSQTGAHGHLQPYQAPVEIEVCINEKEQSRHFHSQERIPNIVELFKQKKARFRMATKGGTQSSPTYTYTYRDFISGVPASAQQVRYHTNQDGTKSVCVKFDDKDFDRHGLSGKTAFGCTATPASIEAIKPYDFPVTQRMGNNGQVLTGQWNEPLTDTAIEKYYGTMTNGQDVKKRPRVFGSSDDWKLESNNMRVYTYNTRLRNKAATASYLHDNPIKVSSTCTQKLEIELDSSIQGSLVVDIRAVQKQQLPAGAAGANKQFVYFSSSQTMINFAPYTKIERFPLPLTDTTQNQNDYVSQVSGQPKYAVGDYQRLRGLAYKGTDMATIYSANAQLKKQGSGALPAGLGGEFGIPEVHAQSAADHPGKEKNADALLYTNGNLELYDASKTNVVLKFNEADGSMHNVARVFDGTNFKENSRVRFSLTFKDKTKCHVRDGASTTPKTMPTPSAIEKRFFNLDWGQSDDSWDNLQRFQITGSYQPDGTSGTSARRTLVFDRKNTKTMNTDIFYGIKKSDEVTMSGLSFNELKNLLDNMKVHPTRSHNTQVCGQYRLEAVVDVINMRSCGRHTKTVRVTADAGWPNCGSATNCDDSYWDIAPKIAKASASWLTRPNVVFRKASGVSSWCENTTPGMQKTYAQGRRCNTVNTDFGSTFNGWDRAMKVAQVMIGTTEPITTQHKNTQIPKGHNWRAVAKMTGESFTTSATALEESKAWMPTWQTDREPDEETAKDYTYVPDTHNAKIPQLTWFSTLEIADLNRENCDNKRGTDTDFRVDIQAAISTQLSRWNQRDASYIVKWESSYGAAKSTNPSESSVNTKDDSYVACDYIRRVFREQTGDDHEDLGSLKLTKLKEIAGTMGITDPNGHKGHKATWIEAILGQRAVAAAETVIDNTLSNSLKFCDNRATNTRTKMARYTVFPSFHAYALATNKAEYFGQACEKCDRTVNPFSLPERKACERSYQTMFPVGYKSGVTTAGCPATLGAVEFEIIRRYSQTFASIGQNGIELALRPALHQMDFSITLQAFDFLDMAQKHTTAASIYKKNTPNKSSKFNNRDVSEPRTEYSDSETIRVIADTDWAGSSGNPKQWERGIAWKSNKLSKDENNAGVTPALTMSFPDNLQDGVCETRINYDLRKKDPSYIELYQAGSAASPTQWDHCTFLPNTGSGPLTHLGTDSKQCPTYGTTSVGADEPRCQLSRQNLDCSPSDGKDNRLSGMQLVLTHPGKLPFAERVDGNSIDRNTLNHFSTDAQNARVNVGKKDGDVNICDLYTGDMKKAYDGNACYFSDAYIDVDTLAKGGQTADAWQFSNHLSATRRGMIPQSACYYNIGNQQSHYCQGQFLLAKEGNCAAGKSLPDRQACVIKYDEAFAASTSSSSNHVWTLSKLPQGDNARFKKVQAAYGVTTRALRIKTFRNWNTQLWNNTADTTKAVDPDIAPRLDVVAWFTTCAKASDSAACLTPGPGNKNAVLNDANQGNDGGQRMTVMTATSDRVNIRTGVENTAVSTTTKLTATDPVDSTSPYRWTTTHPFGKDLPTWSKLESIGVNAKPAPYRDTHVHSYWVKRQKGTSTSPVALYNHDTKENTVVMYENEARMQKQYEDGDTSFMRTVKATVDIKDLFGDMHIYDMTMDFKACTTDAACPEDATSSAYKGANELWKVGRWNSGEAQYSTYRSETISFYGHDIEESYKKRNVPHVIMQNGYQMVATGTDNTKQTSKYPVGNGARQTGDKYRPTTCTIKDTKACQQSSKDYRLYKNSLFLREGHYQGLSARKLEINGGNFVGTQYRKLWIRSRRNHHIKKTMLTIEVSVRSEAMATVNGTHGVTPSAHIAKQSKTIFLDMHPVASAPTMCSMHASNPYSTYSSDTNLCVAKSETALKSAEGDIEMSDWAVPAIVDANEDTSAHPLHYGVVAGTLSKGSEEADLAPYTGGDDHKKDLRRVANADAERGKMMGEVVYWTIRGKTANDKIVLREYDEANKTPGRYVIGLPYGDCPAKEKYARRSTEHGTISWIPDLQTAQYAAQATPVADLAKTDVSSVTPYGAAESCGNDASATPAARAACKKAKREMQYKDASGNYMAPGVSHRDGYNCFRIKVCEVKLDVATKRMKCVGTSGGKFPKFTYQTPRSDANVMVSNDIEMYLTQFKDKTIAINEHGHAVRSAAQSIKIYKDPHISGEHVDWGDAIFTAPGNGKKLKFDWRYYTTTAGTVTAGKNAIGMSELCKNTKFEKMLADAKDRVRASSIYTPGTSAAITAANKVIAQWRDQSGQLKTELRKEPYAAHGTNGAEACNRQISIVPVEYLKKPIKLEVAATKTEKINRLGNVGVKVVVSKVETMNKDTGTWTDAPSKKAEFKWQHTTFAHKQHASVGSDDKCVPGQLERHDTCNVGIIKTSGQGKIDQDSTGRFFMMQYKPSAPGGVQSDIDKWKTCGDNSGQMRVTVTISVPRAGNIASSVVTQVETRTIIFAHHKCGKNTAGARPGIIEYKWGASQLGVFRNGANPTASRNGVVKLYATDAQIAMPMLVNYDPKDQALQIDGENLSLTHSSNSNTVAPSVKVPMALNCDQYSTGAAPSATNLNVWQIVVDGTAVPKSAMDTTGTCISFKDDTTLANVLQFGKQDMVKFSGSSNIPSLNVVPKTITQTFGRGTEQAGRAQLTPYGDELKRGNPQFSCVSLKLTSDQKSRKVVNTGAGARTDICQYSGYSDTNSHAGFCASQIQSSSNNGFVLSDIEQREKWDDAWNTLPPSGAGGILKSHSAGAGTILEKTMQASIVVSEGDIETGLVLSVKGRKGRPTDWPTDKQDNPCKQVETKVTLGKLQYALETDETNTWTNVVDLPAATNPKNDPLLARDRGTSGKAALPARAITAGSSNHNSVTHTWTLANAAGQTAVKPVAIQLHNVIKEQFFGRAQQNHLLRSKLTFETKCVSKDGTNHDKLILDDKCTSKMLYVVQSQRAGQWKFDDASAAPSTVKMTDINSSGGAQVKDTVIRSPTPMDLDVLKFYDKKRTICRPNCGKIALAQIDAKFELDTNVLSGAGSGGAFQSHHRYMNKYNIDMKVGPVGVAPLTSAHKATIIDDLYKPGLYRSLVKFPKIPIVDLSSNEQKMQVQTTLKAKFDSATSFCANKNAKSPEMKLTTRFSKTPSELSSLDPATPEMQREGYAYFKDPTRASHRYSYWSNFQCDKCSKNIKTADSTGTGTKQAVMSMEWGNAADKSRIEMLQPELYFRENAQKLTVTLPARSEVYAEGKGGDPDVAYIYTTGGTCIMQLGSTKRFKKPTGTYPTGTLKDSKCTGDTSSVLVIKRSNLPGSKEDVHIELTYQGSVMDKYTREYKNEVRVHMESMVSCLDTVVTKTVGTTKTEHRPRLMIHVRSNKNLVSRDHATGSTVSHRVVFEGLSLETGDESESIVMKIKTPLSFEANTQPTSCNAGQKAGITDSAKAVSKCWTKTSMGKVGGKDGQALHGTRPELVVTSINKQDETEGLEFTEQMFSDSERAPSSSVQGKPFATNMFQKESTATAVGMCSNKQGMTATYMKDLNLREFAQQLLTGQNDNGVEQRANCTAASPKSNMVLADQSKTFTFNTPTPQGRFKCEALGPSGREKPATHCGREESMLTSIKMNRRELLQCKDPKSLRNSDNKMTNIGGAADAVTVKEDRSTQTPLINYDYSVCTSSTSVRLGVADDRFNKDNGKDTCAKHDDCKLPSSKSKFGGLSFCDRESALCKKATLIGFSNCVNVKLKLNTRFNMWTGKAGKNGQTGEQCVIIPKDVDQEFKKETDPATGQEKVKPYSARLKVTYEIQCPIKRKGDAASSTAGSVIGVFGKANVESALKQMGGTDHLRLDIDSAKTADVNVVTGELVSKTTVVAYTRYFDLKKKDESGATIVPNVFNPDALKIGGKWITNFGLYVNLHTCQVPAGTTTGNWKFPRSSTEMASTQCSDSGIESFPAALQWKFTQYDASKDLNVEMAMTQFKSWMPSLTSKYFEGSGTQVMANREEWWNEQKLPKGEQKLLPTDGLVLSAGITNAKSNAGIQTFIKTATVMRAPKQAYQKGSTMITGNSVTAALQDPKQDRAMDKGHEKAASTSGGDPGKHMLADLILNWKIPADQTWLTTKYLSWPKIGDEPRIIEKFLRQYAEESCTPHLPLYKVKSTTDTATQITTFSRDDNSGIVDWNNAEKNCVCGNSAMRKARADAEFSGDQDLADNRCHYEFSKQFSPVTIIKDGMNDIVGIQMLGGKTAQQTKACLGITKAGASGTGCGSTNAQMMRYDNSGSTAASKLCMMDQGKLITTSFIAMQAARGSLADTPYTDRTHAYRAKCSSAGNDVLPTYVRAVKGKDDKNNDIFTFPFPRDQAEQCRAFDRRGSTDALILGAKVVNGMRGNRFSVQVETAIFDPNASGMSGESCKKPLLECVAGEWQVSNLPNVKTSTGDLQSTQTYKLMTNSADVPYSLAGSETTMMPKPPADGTVPSAVVESDYVRLKYTDGGSSRTVDIHYDGNTVESANIGLSWKSGTFHKLNGANVQRLYAVTGAPKSGFAAVACNAANVVTEGNKFLTGASNAGRKLLGYSGDASTSNAVATVAAPGASKDRRLLQQYGYAMLGHPLESYLAYTPVGGFTRTYQIQENDQGQVTTQIITDQDANAVATSTVNVISENKDDDGHGGRNNHHGNNLDRHHNDDHHHHSTSSDNKAYNVAFWIVLAVFIFVFMICIIAFFMRNRESKIYIPLQKGTSPASCNPTGKRNQSDFRLI